LTSSPKPSPVVDDLAPRIIALFKGPFLNDQGLVSRDFPPTRRTIFDNFDDIVPFLLYFGQAGFLLDQVHRLTPGSFETELPIGNLLHSYKIDEYLGGLNALYQATGDGHVRALLEDAVDKTLHRFRDGAHFAETFDLRGGRASSYFSPWSAGLLETFLEMAELRPDLSEIAARVMDRWCRHPFFETNGLFPFRGSRSASREAAARLTARLRLWCKEPPHLGLMPGEEGLGRWRAAAKCSGAIYRARRATNEWLRSGHWAQLMKSNTTPAFTMIALYETSGDPIWRDRLMRWIDAVTSRMVCVDGVQAVWRPKGPAVAPTLVAGFILIDVLCDVYWRVAKVQRLITTAERIATDCLSWRWHNGLVPMTRGGRWDHLDGQVDFSVSLRRLAELTGKAEYHEAAQHIAEAAMAYHWTPEGLATHVDEAGRIRHLSRNMVDPKYNGLALKALINLQTLGRRAYGDPMLMDLFKDR